MHLATVYAKTFEGENFRGYKTKHLSLEKFHELHSCKYHKNNEQEPLVCKHTQENFHSKAKNQ